MIEIWDLINDSGEKVGITWRREERDKMPEGLHHPCVEIWVKVNDKLLITQRHPGKDDGLKYDVPGGAVLSGESFIDGAMRELCEEVGIIAKKGDLIPLGNTISGKVYAMSYLLELDYLPSLSLQPSEVVGYRLVGEREIEDMRDELTKGTYRRFCIYKGSIFE